MRERRHGHPVESCPGPAPAARRPYSHQQGGVSGLAGLEALDGGGGLGCHHEPPLDGARLPRVDDAERVSPEPLADALVDGLHHGGDELGKDVAEEGGYVRARDWDTEKVIPEHLCALALVGDELVASLRSNTLRADRCQPHWQAVQVQSENLLQPAAGVVRLHYAGT